jgi:hypothetical protein
MEKVTTLYKFGFEYKGVTYAWKDKKLFRLPHTKNKRNYNLKEIKPLVFKSTIVYNIQRNKLTINRLKSLTREVNIKIESFLENTCPF